MIKDASLGPGGTDSKPLSQSRRRELFDVLLKHAASFGAPFVPADLSDDELLAAVTQVRQDKWPNWTEMLTRPDRA